MPFSHFAHKGFSVILWFPSLMHDTGRIECALWRKWDFGSMMYVSLVCMI